MFELAVLLGVLIAVGRRSDLTALPAVRFRGLWFCFLAFALKVILFEVGVRGNPFLQAEGMWLQLAITIILLGLVALNLRLPGMPVVLVGLLANLVVIGLNGGRMPATVAALRTTGQADLIPALQAGEDPGHTLVSAGTRLPWLADWIPLDRLNHKVVSPGDIVVALGLMITVGFALPARPRSPAGTVTENG